MDVIVVSQVKAIQFPFSFSPKQGGGGQGNPPAKGKKKKPGRTIRYSSPRKGNG